MGISRIEVNEYTCELCGYKWVNRINGKDGPIPKRCAKCKNQNWEKEHIGALEQTYRDAIKHKFGYFSYPGGMFYGGWQIEVNVKRYLQRRPSIEEMKVLLHPLCHRYTYQSSHAKPRIGCVPNFALMRSDGIEREKGT
jgi:predicted SprT family Zn-dependent metalloprotease